jgi:hypothetical protein
MGNFDFHDENRLPLGESPARGKVLHERGEIFLPEAVAAGRRMGSVALHLLPVLFTGYSSGACRRSAGDHMTGGMLTGAITGTGMWICPPR